MNLRCKKGLAEGIYYAVSDLVLACLPDLISDGLSPAVWSLGLFPYHLR